MSQPTQQLQARASAGDSVVMRVRGLRKTFKMGESELTVLKGVDLSVGRGEFLAIEGRSGSGKSTLLHLMGALDEGQGGTIEYEGRDIAALGSAARSHLRNTDFGFVFQFYHLLPELTVLENAMLAPMIEFSWMTFRAKHRELRERAEGILAQLQMEHRLKHRPSQLSGGERQRVAIARALMNEPKVLFADEPTGNLDAETGGQIMKVLENLHQTRGQTIVMVTHDRSVARQADRVLVLREGRLERVDER